MGANRTMKRVLTALLLLSSLFGCQKSEPFGKTLPITDAHFNGTVTAQKLPKLNRYRISIMDTVGQTIDRIHTPYEVFDLQTADINHDGSTDICLGIIKPTPFDSAYKKRLFIFRIDNGYIRPLWLGSRLSHTLVNFAVATNTQGQTIVRALEKQDEKNYCINEYKWESFGMAWQRQTDSLLPYQQALAKLKP